MGFDIGHTVNSAADWVYSAPLTRKVVGNPVFVALLITALVCVVAIALYKHQTKRTGFKRNVRALLYIFFLVTAVMFVHHYAVVRNEHQAAAQQGIREVFTGIEQSREIGAFAPVSRAGLEKYGSGAPPRDLGTAERGETGQFDRSDNVAPPDDLTFEIRDVVPATVSPFGRRE